MPLYEYVCDVCTATKEVQCPVEERNSHQTKCQVCGQGITQKVIGNNGGFRLGENGSIGWAKDGYGTTWGDIQNARAGHKVY